MPRLEIEKFFSAYRNEERKWVEDSPEYQLAIKRGKITTALEIASVLIAYFDSGNHSQKKKDIKRIFKKEFPEIELLN